LEIKRKVGKTVKVTWTDAFGEIGKSKSDLENINPSDLLVTCETFGVLHSVDDNAIMIFMEESSLNCDVTVIPLAWIISIKEMREVKNGRK